jgi:hypothetical protein
MKKNQKMYMGPRLHAYGIGYGCVFYNGVHAQMKNAIKACPSVGQLLVPIEQAGAVRRQLKFDYAHNMRGTDGKYVTFYQEVIKWLSSQQKKPAQKTPNLEVKHHA